VLVDWIEPLGRHCWSRETSVGLSLALFRSCI
jgi:hypothetical protein